MTRTAKPRTRQPEPEPEEDEEFALWSRLNQMHAENQLAYRAMESRLNEIWSRSESFRPPISLSEHDELGKRVVAFTDEERIFIDTLKQKYDRGLERKAWWKTSIGKTGILLGLLAAASAITVNILNIIHIK